MMAPGTYSVTFTTGWQRWTEDATTTTVIPPPQTSTDAWCYHYEPMPETQDADEPRTKYEPPPERRRRRAKQRAMRNHFAALSKPVGFGMSPHGRAITA